MLPPALFYGSFRSTGHHQPYHHTFSDAQTHNRHAFHLYSHQSGRVCVGASAYKCLQSVVVSASLWPCTHSYIYRGQLNNGSLGVHCLCKGVNSGDCLQIRKMWPLALAVIDVVELHCFLSYLQWFWGGEPDLGDLLPTMGVLNLIDLFYLCVSLSLMLTHTWEWSILSWDKLQMRQAKSVYFAKSHWTQLLHCPIAPTLCGNIKPDVDNYVELLEARQHIPLGFGYMTPSQWRQIHQPLSLSPKLLPIWAKLRNQLGHCHDFSKNQTASFNRSTPLPADAQNFVLCKRQQPVRVCLITVGILKTKAPD